MKTAKRKYLKQGDTFSLRLPNNTPEETIEWLNIQPCLNKAIMALINKAIKEETTAYIDPQGNYFITKPQDLLGTHKLEIDTNTPLPSNKNKKELKTLKDSEEFEHTQDSHLAPNNKKKEEDKKSTKEIAKQESTLTKKETASKSLDLNQRYKDGQVKTRGFGLADLQGDALLPDLE